jgi:hypothetical protein
MSDNHSHYVWPIGIISFFIALASFYIFYLIPLAIEEGSSPVSDNPYEDANAYQGVIDEEKTANEISLNKVAIEIKKPSELLDGNRKVVVDIASIEPKWLEGFIDAKLKFSYTSTDVFDFETKLHKTENNSLEVEFVLPRTGLWLLELRINSAEGSALLRRSQMLD